MVKKIHLKIDEAISKDLYVYLPIGYNNEVISYPVVYMFDGQNLFFDEDAYHHDSWHIGGYLDKSQYKLIVVGISNPGCSKGRESEYVPYNCKGFYGDDITTSTPQVFSWIIKSIKPYIDSQFRTLKGREHTAIMGASYGGLAAIYEFVNHNKFFSLCAALSPTIKIVSERLTDELQKNKICGKSKIFLSYGTNEVNSQWAKESVGLLEAFSSKAMGIGIESELNIYEGYSHSIANWGNAFNDALSFLFQSQ